MEFFDLTDAGQAKKYVSNASYFFRVCISRIKLPENNMPCYHSVNANHEPICFDCFILEACN